MNDRELRELREQIRQKMQDAGTMRPLPKDGKAERLERGRADKAWFLRTYCPHYFLYEFTPHHVRVLERCNTLNTPYVLSAFRGFGKSALASFGDPLWKAVFELRHFFLLVSYTEDIAESFTSPLKVEFEENPRLRQDFGNLVGSRIWTGTDFVLKNDRRFLARSIMQPFRGLRHGPYRPDDATLDDYENDSTAESPEQTEKIGNRIWKTLRPALQRKKDGGFSLKVVGTTITPECNQTQLLDDTERHLLKDRIAIVNDDGDPTWPDVYERGEIDGIFRDVGLTARHSEYLLDPLPAGERDFRKEWIQYADPLPAIPFMARVTYGAIDPSSTSSGDPKALIVLTLDKVSMRIYVRHAWIKKASPKELCKAVHELQQLYQCEFAIEENSLKDYLWEAVENYEKDHACHLRLRPVHHSLSKPERIRKLQSPIERQQIQFQKGHSDQDELIRQLLAFPSRSSHDDGPDALEEAYQQVMRRVRRGRGKLESLGRRETADMQIERMDLDAW